MEEFFRKHHHAIQIYGTAGYLLLVLGIYFSNITADALISRSNFFLLLSMLAVTTIAFWTHRYSPQHTDIHENRRNLAAGLTFWSLAQVSWMLFPAVLAERGITLNLVDIFWFTGAIFLLRVIVFQDDFKAREQSHSIIIGISGTVAVIAAVPLFISLPILQTMNGAHIIGYLTRIGYIGLTLAFIPFSWISFSFKRSGFSGSAWNAFAAAFIVWALTTLAQAYFIWYAPLPGRPAAILNILYIGIYLFLTANIYISWIFEQEAGLGTKLKLGFIGQDREIPQFLLHTDAQGLIVFISNNFLQFTNNSLPERYLGKPLREVIGISEQEFEQLTETCAQGAFVVQQDIKVAAGQKAPVPLFFTAVGSITGNEYFGMDIILHLPNYSGQAYPLDSESSAIAQRILNRTGQNSKENGARLAEYFVAHVQAFKELVTNMRGNKIAAAMDKEVNNVAEKNKWPIRLEGQDLNIEPGFDSFDNAQLVKALPILYKIAQQYATNASSLQAVTQQINTVNKTLNPKVVETARQFGLR